MFLRVISVDTTLIMLLCSILFCYARGRSTNNTNEHKGISFKPLLVTGALLRINPSHLLSHTAAFIGATTYYIYPTTRLKRRAYVVG
jgi:hypothetical protein